jgi:hypothetical protein
MSIAIDEEQLTRWAHELLSINHYHTLIQRELDGPHWSRARELSERARRHAWETLNELFAAGARKPDGYAEPGVRPDHSN